MQEAKTALKVSHQPTKLGPAKENVSKAIADDNESGKDLSKPEVPMFDVGFYERKLQLEPEYPTLKSQAIMKKPAAERTEDEIEMVQDELENIEFFENFPHHVQHELCMEMIFLSVNSGHFILKEGQKPMSMYIIISGIVNAFRHEIDPETNTTYIKRLGEFSHGMFFGHEDLLLDTNRTISVRCKITAQLLELNKALFDKLIRKILLRNETLIRKTFHTLETLSHFDIQEKEYTDLVISSKLKQFPAHTILFGKTTELSPYVYFIVSGECALEQDVEFIVERGLGFTRLLPVPPGTSPNSEDPKVHRKRLETGVIMRGHYFGMGEDMSQRYVRSLCHVETLMVPRHLLVAKRVDIFDKLKEQFEHNMPSLQEILDKYLDVLNWQRYEDKVLQQVFNQRLKKLPTITKPRFIKYC